MLEQVVEAADRWGRRGGQPGHVLPAARVIFFHINAQVRMKYGDSRVVCHGGFAHARQRLYKALQFQLDFLFAVNISLDDRPRALVDPFASCSQFAGYHIGGVDNKRP